MATHCTKDNILTRNEGAALSTFSSQDRGEGLADEPGLEAGAPASFFLWAPSIGGRGIRLIVVSAVRTRAMMNAGEKNMIVWCENGIVSVVSPGNHGGSYAELARARPVVGALS